MKGKFFFFIWGVTLVFIMMILRVQALLDFSNLDLANWTQDILSSKTEKIVWMVVSISCFFVFVLFAANVYQKNKGVYMLRLDESKVVLMSNLKKRQVAHSTHIADASLREDVAH